MKKNYFITGTDTDCGKTLITEALLLKAAQKGLRTAGLKPIAAGAEHAMDGWKNADAIRLQNAANVKIPYDQVNPVLFNDPVAPHIAASISGRRISVASLAGFVRGAMLQPADLRLVEGAGGWLVPLNERETLADLPKLLGLDVILVVGLKLGCLNHALLTAKAIRMDGLHIAAWVATQTDPAMTHVQENFDSLVNMLGAPCLGFVPYIENITAEMAGQHLQLMQ